MIFKIVSVLTLIYLPLFVEAIFGGKDVTDPHKYPWMVKVSIWYNDHYKVELCGGSIISKTVVMTAAHCVKSRKGIVAKFVRISVGHSNLNSNEIVDIVVEAIKIHPQYAGKITWWENDIALLQLSKELQFKKSIQPIDLPNQNYTDAVLLDTSKTKLIAAGWGRAFQISEEEVKPYRDEGFNTTQSIEEFLEWHKNFTKKAKTTKNLKFLEFYYQTPEECIRVIKIMLPFFIRYFNANKLIGTNICASGKVPEIQSVCHGDSGGPLMRQDLVTGNFQVIGIASRVVGGCSTVLSNSYTKVSRHVQWIYENSDLSRGDRYFKRKYTNPWLK